MKMKKRFGILKYSTLTLGLINSYMAGASFTNTLILNKQASLFGTLIIAFYTVCAVYFMRSYIKFAMATSDYKIIESNNMVLDSMKTVNTVAERYKDSYLDAHQAWTHNQDMANILIDIITINGMEEKIIELVKQEMELEREDDFACHAEEAYKELINELQTRWDFMNDKV
ncbi:hypothetical protein B9T62_14095 [Paenibacillus donghaensis]|uniref:Uncharacterized protein n=2 Tax=Paenibacillus donghaensis TaxID=414771 RepID=A0A2Z2KFA5_9BACL|nr:hypothetical protein B9T62_14095 [Paenibacillus donghaensis]